MVSRLRVCLTHTILFALSTCFAASADSHSISKRSIQDDLDAIKGGVLLKNGKQTSCELGLIDSKSAFVMSQCFDFVNNAVDLTSKYEVLLDTGLDGKAARYTVESIYVHPNTMGANTGNDVSVIQFNSAGQVEWLNTIGTMPELNWDSMVYVRRSLKDINKMIWDSPQIVQASASQDDSTCKSMSSMYAKNTIDFKCSNAIAKPPSQYLSDCPVPYGTAYAYISGKLYMVGIFSHSSTLNGNSGNLCKYDDYRGYYVLFSHLIFYAAAQTGRKVDGFPLNYTTNPGIYPKYEFVLPSTTEGNGINIYKGDFYTHQIESINSLTTGSNTKPSLSSTKAEINTASSSPSSAKSRDTSDSATGTDSEGSEASAPTTGASQAMSSDGFSGDIAVGVSYKPQSSTAHAGESNDDTNDQQENGDSHKKINKSAIALGLSIPLVIFSIVCLALLVRRHYRKRDSLESIDTQHKPDIEPKPRTEPVIEPGANSAQDSAITSWDIPSRPVTFAYTFSGNFSYQQSRIPSRIPTLLSTQQAESVRATYRYPQSPWRTTTQYITRPPTYTPIDERALSRASSWA